MKSPFPHALGPHRKEFGEFLDISITLLSLSTICNQFG